MPSITLHPIDPDRDLGEIASLLSTYNDEVTTEAELKEEYIRDKERINQQGAYDEEGNLAGFYWTSNSHLEEGRVYANLIVKPEYRHAGVGHHLAVHMEKTLSSQPTKRLRLTVLDTDPAYKSFAEMRGYTALQHLIGMELDLDKFGERHYQEIINRLKDNGFKFTSMEALGNTEEAQRKLYQLNDTASSETMGGLGEHSWASFEDFQKRVCQSDWYIPGGQIVVIDTATGVWAAMSAITRLQGTDYAYNLFTGVDWYYRGRQLAQAVKATALCYARDVLKVRTVRTHHNTDNLPMIHIDRKFGYVDLPGHYTMEKVFAS
jgi:RimJ/RimL family protein N-acetyltransferase